MHRATKTIRKHLSPPAKWISGLLIGKWDNIVGPRFTHVWDGTETLSDEILMFVTRFTLAEEIGRDAFFESMTDEERDALGFDIASRVEVKFNLQADYGVLSMSVVFSAADTKYCASLVMRRTHLNRFLAVQKCIKEHLIRLASLLRVLLSAPHYANSNNPYHRSSASAPSAPAPELACVTEFALTLESLFSSFIPSESLRIENTFLGIPTADSVLASPTFVPLANNEASGASAPASSAPSPVNVTPSPSPSLSSFSPAEKEFLARVITSHLQTHGHTIVIGEDRVLVQRWVDTLSFFSSAKERQLSTRCTSVHTSPSSSPASVFSPFSPIDPMHQFSVSSHYVPDAYIQGIVLPHYIPFPDECILQSQLPCTILDLRFLSHAYSHAHMHHSHLDSGRGSTPVNPSVASSDSQYYPPFGGFGIEASAAIPSDLPPLPPASKQLRQQSVPSGAPSASPTSALFGSLASAAAAMFPQSMAGLLRKCKPLHEFTVLRTKHWDAYLQAVRRAQKAGIAVVASAASLHALFTHMHPPSPAPTAASLLTGTMTRYASEPDLSSMDSVGADIARNGSRAPSPPPVSSPISAPRPPPLPVPSAFEIMPPYPLELYVSVETAAPSVVFMLETMFAMPVPLREGFIANWLRLLQRKSLVVVAFYEDHRSSSSSATGAANSAPSPLNGFSVPDSARSSAGGFSPYSSLPGSQQSTPRLSSASSSAQSRNSAAAAAAFAGSVAASLEASLPPPAAAVALDFADLPVGVESLVRKVKNAMPELESDDDFAIALATAEKLCPGIYTAVSRDPTVMGERVLELFESF